MKKIEKLDLSKNLINYVKSHLINGFNISERDAREISNILIEIKINEVIEALNEREEAEELIKCVECGINPAHYLSGKCVGCEIKGRKDLISFNGEF